MPDNLTPDENVCPASGTPARAGYRGQTVECPECGKSIVLGGDIHESRGIVPRHLKPDSERSIPPTSNQRLTPEQLAEYREIVPLGIACGVGGAALAALLDEIERLTRERDDAELRFQNEVSLSERLNNQLAALSGEPGSAHETSGDSEVERLTRERDHFQTLAAVRGRELLKRAELLQEVQAQVDQLKCSHGWSAGMCPAEDCVHYPQDSCYRHCEVFPKGRGCPKCNAEKASAGHPPAADVGPGPHVGQTYSRGELERHCTCAAGRDDALRHSDYCALNGKGDA